MIAPNTDENHGIPQSPAVVTTKVGVGVPRWNWDQAVGFSFEV